jgi:hypothetical protein
MSGGGQKKLPGRLNVTPARSLMGTTQAAIVPSARDMSDEFPEQQLPKEIL